MAGGLRERRIPSAFIPSLGRRLSPAVDISAFWRILQEIRRVRPDVVHTHMAKAGTLGRLAALAYNGSRRRRHRCAVVHTFHGHVFEGYFGQLGTRLTRIVERLLATMTDRVIAISDRQRHDIVDKFRITSGDRVSTVALGLELKEYLQLPAGSDARCALQLTSDAVVVGFVGRLAPIKRVDLLLRACAIAREHEPALLVMIAGDGEMRQELTRLANDLGMADGVRFLGWREDLPSVYASMDVFALTSANEGTPVALIEAMAAGVPAAVTAVGGVPDVVGSSPRCVLIGSDSPADVSAAILAALRIGRKTDRDLSERRAVIDRFGVERLVTDIASVYEAAIARRAAG